MQYVVGIDEVGRGPLAGPITVCVVACEKKLYSQLKRSKKLPPKGKDSKLSSKLERKNYSKILRSIISTIAFGDGNISYSISHVSNTIIDKRGLTFATNLAIKRGIKKLELLPEKSTLLLDGSLKGPKEFINQKTIIKGDEKEKIISWASILGKVRRDALMGRLAKKYPQYGFEIHKGYGTKMHRKAIRKNGLSKVHRKSFCRNI
jgi:ribonuclease HII